MKKNDVSVLSFCIWSIFLLSSQPIFNENPLIPKEDVVRIGVLKWMHSIFFFVIGHLIISKYATFLFSSWAAAVKAKCFAWSVNIWFFSESNKLVGEHFPVWAIALCVGLVFAFIVAVVTKSDRQPRAHFVSIFHYSKKPTLGMYLFSQRLNATRRIFNVVLIILVRSRFKTTVIRESLQKLEGTG